MKSVVGLPDYGMVSHSHTPYPVLPFKEERGVMNQDIDNLKFWKDHLEAAETNMETTLRMIDSILEIVESPQNLKSSPELCNDVKSLAARIRSSLSERLIALEDLLGFLKEYEIKK
jgi:hypothetical protein